jgi:glutathione synthase/RimK-type ligase-like ATP-grasp enzyme
MNDVLIITHSNDNNCVETVTAAVEARGGRAIRFDTDCFPTEILFSGRRGPGAPLREVTAKGVRCDLDRCSGIWYRRINLAAKLPQLEPQVRAACINETRRTLFGMLIGHDGFVLDREVHLRRAESKDLQLALAEKVGMQVPRTLVSNDPEQVRAFAADCGGNIVTKMQASFAIYEQGKEQVVFTNTVSASDLADLDGLRYSPMVFQEKLEKALELRVTVVGDRVFAAALDSQRVDRGKTDWRRAGAQTVGDWRPFDLPRDLERQMLALCDELELNYGAADVILTPDDRFVFLEINPNGEFFWLDFAPERPISAAIADVLLGLAARR